MKAAWYAILVPSDPCGGSGGTVRESWTFSSFHVKRSKQTSNVERILERIDPPTTKLRAFSSFHVKRAKKANVKNGQNEYWDTT
jgi:hypothetical protein